MLRLYWTLALFVILGYWFIATNLKTTSISSRMKIFRTRSVRTSDLSRLKLEETTGVSPWCFINMIKISIPGKIHLIGEHSVVYGKPAILASVNLYLSAKITKSKTKEILGIVHYDDAIYRLQNSIEKKIKEKFGVEIPMYKIEIDKTQIPVGSGLGTSASLSSAFAICLLKFLKIDYTEKDIFDIAIEGEKIFHGNPSGGDLAAVLQSGIILFRKGKTTNKIKPLGFKIPEEIANLVLINSGKPAETTAEMLQLVKDNYARSQSEIIGIFQSQGALATRMAKVLKKGDQEKFIKIIKKAERNLEKLGVVGEAAKQIIHNIETLGGAGKISGAGGIKEGSGMILAFHEDPNTIVEFAKKNKYDYYSITI